MNLRISFIDTIILTLIGISLFLPLEIHAQNRLYVIEKNETPLYSNARDNSKQINSSKELLTLHRRDTVEAAPETETFIVQHDTIWMRTIPVMYKGVHGYVFANNLRPVKAEPTDSIYPIHEKPLHELSRLDQDLLKWQTIAMNLPVDAMDWLWLYLIALGASLIFIVIGKYSKSFPTFFDWMVLLALSIASLAEMIYFIAMGDHAFWFYSYKYVGWLWAILGFFGTIAVLVLQVVIFCSVCNNYFDGTTRNRYTPLPGWIDNMWAYPLLVVVLTIILYIVDSFVDHKITLIGFTSIYLLLPIMGIAGAIYLITKGKIFKGILYPILYSAASVGISLWATTLGLTILLMVVAVGAVILVIGILGEAGSTNHGYTRYTGRTVSGKKVTGWLSRDKKYVYGDDGDVYFFKE